MNGKRRSSPGHWLLLVALASGPPPRALADPVDFRRDVWPILQERCVRCHGPAKQKSSLRLDSRAALLKGGDNGPAIVAGAPEKSYLLELVSARKGDLRMPPDGEGLSAAQIDTLRRWIAEAANWSADFAPATARHWAFEPVTRPAVPDVKSGRFAIHNPIDAFLTAKLVERGLKMAPPADPRTLIRRLTLDLTGLPPTPEAVEEFVNASSGGGEETAYRTLLDRLLASPRYGERWAQHWLDVIRYADTSGYEFNAVRPNAWPYRDYVIASLNADISYPRFILEQLAGDTLGVDPATGFLVTPPFPSRIEVGQEAAAIAQARYNGLDEVVQNLGSAILGMTVGCARCHDHKFDPVSTRDYYRLVATFAGLQFVDRPWRSGPLPVEEIRSAEQRLADLRNRLQALPAWREVEPVRTTDYFRPVTAKWIKLTVRDTFTGRGYAPALDEVEVWTPGSNGKPPRNVGSAEAGARVRSSGPDQSLGASDAFLNDGQVGSQSRWVARDRIDKARAWVEIELPEPTLVHGLVTTCDYQEQGNDLVAAKWRTLKQWHIEVAQQPGQWRTVVAANRDQGLTEAEITGRKALEQRFAQAAERLGELQNIFAGRFRTPEPSHVLRRGNPLEPREVTGPGGIAVLGGYELTTDAAEAERRLALARWLGRPEHPLTARVLVNRGWRHHFGVGLVDTPSDFGTQGERPTHPELLDWLASEFMARGWKLKDLHRLICTSAAYRQSSRPDAAALKADADSRLLWRFPPRRLEAEAIRDSILFSSGSLDLTMGGPGINFYQPRSKPDSRWLPVEKPGPETWRRTIYLLRVRGADDGLFQPFDVPDCGQVRAKRSTSTTPLQAMNLLNSPFIIEQAQRLADRAQREAGQDVDRQVQRVFTLTLARPPAEQELAAGVAVARQHGLATVARALFNANEFLFLE
jgi:hypothetical protein